MSKLIPMDEAASILGMTEDQVAELRSSNEIFGYRDGATWKFKMSELERVADERGISLNVAGSAIDAVKGKIDEAVSELGLALEESDDDLLLDEPDSVELMEDSSVELFSSPLGDSPSDSVSVSDSSVKLDDLSLLDEDDDDSLKLGSSSAILKSDSDKPAAPESPAKKADDSIDLSSSSIFDSDEALSFGSSSLKLAGDADNEASGSDLLLDDAPAASDSGSGTGKDIGKADDDDLLLVDDDDELSLEDSVSFDDSVDLGSSLLSDGDGLKLDDSDSDVDLKLESNESSINLAISESGISLSSDEPLELGGSDIDALKLDDDDDDVIMVDEIAGEDDPTLMQEDDFNLTPLEEGAPVADSTSQVIAMEDSAVFADESAATALGEGDFEAELSDDSGFGDGFGDDGLGADDGLYEDTALAGAGVAAAAVPEIEYSKWQLISLGLVSTMLLAGSLVAYDLARNMWMPENQTVGRGVLKFFLGLVNMD